MLLYVVISQCHEQSGQNFLEPSHICMRTFLKTAGSGVDLANK